MTTKRIDALKEKILDDFREQFPQFKGVGASFPIFKDTPVYTHVVQFIERALTSFSQELLAEKRDRIKESKECDERECYKGHDHHAARLRDEGRVEALTILGEGKN